MSEPTLFYRPGACALAPHILLIAVGAPHELAKAPRDDTYRRINPTGAVPALQLADGRVLTQCHAILQYIAETAGRPDLLGGDDALSRAEVAKWCAFMTGDFHPAFFPVFVPQRYVSDQAEAVLDGTKAAGIRLVRAGLDQIEAHLNGRDWLAAPGPTIADYYAVPMLRWCGWVIDGGLAGWPRTQNLYQRLSALDEVTRAMDIQGIAP